MVAALGVSSAVGAEKKMVKDPEPGRWWRRQDMAGQ